MEVEAVDEGVVEAILVPEGTEGVKVNTPIARLKGERRSAAPPPRLGRRRRSRKPENPRRQGRAPPPQARKPAQAPEAGAAPTADAGWRRASSPRRWPAAWPSRTASTSPTVKGSGPHGRIIRRDVEGAEAGAPAPRRAAAAPAAGAAPGPVAWSRWASPPGSYDLVPLDGMRKTIARRMTDSFRDVPHFPLTIDLEIDAPAGRAREDQRHARKPTASRSASTTW